MCIVGIMGRVAIVRIISTIDIMAFMKLTLLAKKGGVGKSTVSILLYEAFRQAGKSVSIQDWDAQGTSSKSLELIGGEAGARNPKPEIMIYDTPPSLEHTATATAVRNADIALVVT